MNGSRPTPERDVLAEMAAVRAQVDRGETSPLPFDVGPFRPTGRLSPLRWLVLLALVLIGAVLFAAIAPAGVRAGLSFAGGVLAAVAALELGTFNIRVVDRFAPQLTMAAALFSYLLTGVVFALVLAASSPRVVSGAGVAAGLGAGLAVWLGALLVASRVRPAEL